MSPPERSGQRETACRTGGFGLFHTGSGPTGAMPEVAPSPGFTADIDRPFTDRSMMLQG